MNTATAIDARAQYDEFMITGMVAGFEPVVVDRALGTSIFDQDGTEYLDCFSGISVCNAGHNHPRIIAAAKAQMEKLVHCCTYVYYNPVAAQLAEDLAGVLPGSAQKTFFGNSGAEALEGAMRLAKQFTGRNELISLTQSFHGRTVGTLSITGNMGRKKAGGPYMPGVSFAPAPHPYRCPFGTTTEDDCAIACAEAFEDCIRYHSSGNVAAFIAEPIMGEGGIIVPPKNYFRYIKEICDRYDILFIADEVQSGFGRTGKMFAIEHYGVEPDIICTAKGIADGFPLSAFTARADIAEAFKPGDHLSTFGGNPVSCAAAIANIAVMHDEDLPNNAAVRGQQIMNRMKSFAESHAIIGDVRGQGLMIGIELISDADKTPDPVACHAVRQRCREMGVLIGAGGTFGNILRIQPPLCLNADEADRICHSMSSALAEIEALS